MNNQNSLFPIKVIKSGFLIKRSKRYVVLTNTKIFCFTGDTNDSTCTMMVDLTHGSSVTVYNSDNDKSKLCFVLKDGDEEFHFKATNSVQKNEWLIKIKLAIANLKIIDEKEELEFEKHNSIDIQEQLIIFSLFSMEATSTSTNESLSELKHKLFIKDKNGVYVLEPFKSQTEKRLQVDVANIVIQSKNYLGVISGGIFHLFENSTLQLIKKFDEFELVANAHFSHSNELLVIIQKPSVNNNLKKYAFHSTTHPSSQWPQINFSLDENYIFKLLKGNLEILKLSSSEENTSNVDKTFQTYGKITGIINYEISEIANEQLKETAIICGRVVLDEKTKKKKSLVTVYKLSDLSKPIKEMNVSICDRMKIKVSPDRTAVLLQSFSDDSSSTSYYGESSIYFLDLLYGKFQKLSLPEGQIHDFDWTPNGLNYVVCAGHQPSKTHIYSNTSKFLKEVCVSKLNTIKISPDSKILCMAGFGNLNGDLEFYRMSDFKLIGKTKFYCGITLNWAADSRFLLGAVLSPRVRVDNEYKIFSYNGEDVIGEKFNGEIFECEWVKTQDIVYSEYSIEVSKQYLQKLEVEKEKNKKKSVNSISNNLNNLSLSTNPTSSKNKVVPGMKKK